MYSWSSPTVFECVVLVKEVEESQKQRSGGGSEVKREGMIIGLFSVTLKITALWNLGRHVDVSE
jgi:hypothetical protein